MPLPPPNHLLTALIQSLSSLTTHTSPLTSRPPETQSQSQHHTPRIPIPPHHANDGSHPFLSTLPPHSASKAKHILLTLHFLFPHELLPALDILDRGLVTCLRFPLSSPPHLDDNHPEAIDTFPADTSTQAVPDPAPMEGLAPPSSAPPQLGSASRTTVYGEVFYVQSSSASILHDAVGPSTGRGKSRSRYERRSRSQVYYEVRLDSWNCTCPAFAYSTYTLLTSTIAGIPHALENEERDRRSEQGHEDTTRTVEEGWQYGGTTTRQYVGTPMCKHILAAVLGRGAGNLFRDGVKTQMVGMEDVAGWGGGFGDYGWG